MAQNEIDIELMKNKKGQKWISVGYGNAHIVFLLCISSMELINFLKENIETISFKSLEVGSFGNMPVFLNIFSDDNYQILIDGPEIEKDEAMSFSLYFSKETCKHFINGVSHHRLIDE